MYVIRSWRADFTVRKGVSARWCARFPLRDNLPRGRVATSQRVHFYLLPLWCTLCVGKKMCFACRRGVNQVNRPATATAPTCFLTHDSPHTPCMYDRVSLQVDEGMSRLRARAGGLTAAALANTEQEELADILRHVHWNKVCPRLLGSRHLGKVLQVKIQQHRRNTS